MSRTMNLLRGVAVAGLFGVLASCEAPHSSVEPSYAGGDIFKSYVALGNSLTAGYQSGGINDSTQQRSYAVLLAQAFGTRFAYPSLVNPGCPPPIANFMTQARVTPKGYPASTSTSCYLRSATSITDVLNNVAVPGANVADLTSSVGTSGPNPLTQFILGGLTQAQRALIAKPTFATVWIGNNDVLGPALTGQPAGATPLATFTGAYDTMISQLTGGAPGIKGVLIGVVQVSAAPQLFPAAALASPVFDAGMDAGAGQHVTVLPDCLVSPGNQSLININIIGAIRLGLHPPIIACRKGDAPAPVGDYLVLDTEEQATVYALINSYNAYIQSKAQAIGFAYWDPNPALAALDAQPGAILRPPNIGSATNPFGTAFSLDGVHPSSSSHILVANGIIDAINAKYGTSVKHVQ